MKFKLEITLGNAEMETGYAVAEALKGVAQRLRRINIDGEGAKIMDINGNSVGFWEVVNE